MRRSSGDGKTIPARLTTGLDVEGPLVSATKYLLAAEHEQPSIALRHDLLAAKISHGVLERHPKTNQREASKTSPYPASYTMSIEQILSRGACREKDENNS
jgi:hypothetical protein